MQSLGIMAPSLQVFQSLAEQTVSSIVSGLETIQASCCLLASAMIQLNEVQSSIVKRFTASQVPADQPDQRPQISTLNIDR